MAVFESTHPLGQNMETIFGALNAGITSESGIFPDHIKVDYVDPFEGDGVGKLRIADWKTENRANIYFPVAVDAEGLAWNALCSDGMAPVRQRIHIQDILVRGFELDLEGKKVVTSYLQFDVLDEGIIFSFEVDKEQTVVYGGFEGHLYDTYELLVKQHASIAALVDLASRY